MPNFKYFSFGGSRFQWNDPCSFLFEEVSVELGGLIEDLLSFGLVLEGDFSMTHLVGCVVGDSSMLFS